MNYTPVAFIQNLSTPEIVMIGCVILLFFGAKRLPELVRSLGKSVGEFNRAKAGIEEDFRSAMDVKDIDNKPRPQEAKAPAESA
ncbi:twin-arginine translocase TatA/TatE family subunit [Coraliomargarita algicola]|uniref:Twin-arginine translocase TatA/TatE family subunit n=1 Tax=Coraliomargarita algicola TaxID=3092156 RepID=A0ABZ0RM75_9BACT|nr:twin-arginine translocase TatA/TatE family subunit [Coraliomargarita sp. J2-16]WPJ96339.1 twin-arginine translocase TatA/TatE family subunit [Coraliomargarita sp. J2-16]